MSTNQITLSYDQLRAIARYELTLQDILGDEPLPNVEFVYPTPYVFRLQDLRCAIENIKRIQPTYDAFAGGWYELITDLSEAFSLFEIPQDEEDEIRKGFNLSPFLKLTENDFLESAWVHLEINWEECQPDYPIDFDFDQILEFIDRYYRNKGKPIEEREYDVYDKRNYIRLFDDGELTKTASELELALCRRFVDELCEQDDAMALHIKGYSCYGGDRLYPCDWYTSRDCITRLYQKKDDPQCANTLGYIYYYGRCNHGVPEYDKAFRYYSVAAASGLYEGMYKLADMLCHGYGCIKSPSAARKLYTMVYNDSLNSFLHGSDANFADIALRIGNVYANGIGLPENTPFNPYQFVMAYGFYLQAQYASDLRLLHSDFFGDKTVADGIQRALEETRAKLPKDFFQPIYDMMTPDPMRDLTDDNYLCELTREVKKNGSVWLKANRIPKRGEKKPPFILLCYPAINYCERVTKVMLEICEEKGSWFRDNHPTVRYDYMKYNKRMGRTEFYHQGTMTAWVAAKAFRIHGKHKPKPRGKKYTLVSVQFQPDGTSYDYLTDRNDIQPGDSVIVSSHGAEKAVTVVSVTVRRESELTLPLEKYKKILRKAEDDQ